MRRKPHNYSEAALEKRRQACREYYQKNKDKERARLKEYYRLKREGKLASSKSYYEKHKEQILAYRKERRERMKKWFSAELVLNGEKVTMYSIGEIARRLGRDPQTIRKWERDGVIPVAMFRDVKNRRMYTQEQIEAIVKIAKEEGILVCNDFSETKFTERVYKEFEKINSRMEKGGGKKRG